MIESVSDVECGIYIMMDIIALAPWPKHFLVIKMIMNTIYGWKQIHEHPIADMEANKDYYKWDSKRLEKAKLNT